MSINFMCIKRTVQVCLFLVIVSVSFAAEFGSLTVGPNLAGTAIINLPVPSTAAATVTFIKIRAASGVTPEFSVMPDGGSCPYLAPNQTDPIQGVIYDNSNVYMGTAELSPMSSVQHNNDNVYTLVIYHANAASGLWKLKIRHSSTSSEDFNYAYSNIDLNDVGVPAYTLNSARSVDASGTLDFSKNDDGTPRTLYKNNPVVLNANIFSCGTKEMKIVNAVFNGTGCNAFSIVPPPPDGISLLPNENKPIQITFNPPSTGDFSCTLTLKIENSTCTGGTCGTLQLIANNVITHDPPPGVGSCIIYDQLHYYNLCIDFSKYIAFDYRQLIPGPFPPGCPMCMVGVISTPDPIYLPSEYRNIAAKLDIKVSGVQKVLSSVKNPGGSFVVKFLFSNQDRPVLTFSSERKTIFNKLFPTIEDKDFAGGIKEFTPGKMANNKKLYFMAEPSGKSDLTIIAVKEINVDNEGKVQSTSDVKLGKEAIYSCKGALTLGIGGQMIYRPARIIENIPGDDFTIFVNPKDSTADVHEWFTVEVKAPNSNSYVRLGTSPGKTCSFDINSVGLSKVEEIRIIDKSIRLANQNDKLNPNLGVNINAIGVWRAR